MPRKAERQYKPHPSVRFCEACNRVHDVREHGSHQRGNHRKTPYYGSKPARKPRKTTAKRKASPKKKGTGGKGRTLSKAHLAKMKAGRERAARAKGRAPKRTRLHKPDRIARSSALSNADPVAFMNREHKKYQALQKKIAKAQKAEDKRQSKHYGPKRTFIPGVGWHESAGYEFGPVTRTKKAAPKRRKAAAPKRTKKTASRRPAAKRKTAKKGLTAQELKAKETRAKWNKKAKNL